MVFKKHKEKAIFSKYTGNWCVLSVSVSIRTSNRLKKKKKAIRLRWFYCLNKGERNLKIDRKFRFNHLSRAGICFINYKLACRFLPKPTWFWWWQELWCLSLITVGLMSRVKVGVTYRPPWCPQGPWCCHCPAACSPWAQEGWSCDQVDPPTHQGLGTICCSCLKFGIQVML